MKRNQIAMVAGGALITILLGATFYASYMNLKLKQELEGVQKTTFRYDEEYLTALAQSSDPQAQITHNSSTGLWDQKGNRRLSLTKIWQIGYDDKAHQELNIQAASDMHAGSGSNLYIYESSAGKIFCFDAQGKLQYILGNKGQGPGELSGYVHFAVIHDSLIYTCDFGNQRISTFLLNNHGAAYLSSFRLQMEKRPQAFAMSGEESFFLGYYEPSTGYLIHQYDQHGKKMTSFGQPLRLDMPNKFVLRTIENNHYVGDMAIANGSLFFTQGNPYKVDVFSLSGRLLRQITRENDFLKPPDILIRGKDTYTFRAPASSSCVRLLDSLIVNALYFPAITTPEAMTILDIFDLQGRLLTSLKMPERVYIAEISPAGNVYGKVWDDEANGFLHIGGYTLSLD